MEKSVLDIICASLDSFFESERKIGTYIIQHTAEVVDMTVGELAQACGVSDASVSRFCKKINMISSFKDYAGKRNIREGNRGGRSFESYFCE